MHMNIKQGTPAFDINREGLSIPLTIYSVLYSQCTLYAYTHLILIGKVCPSPLLIIVSYTFNAPCMHINIKQGTPTIKQPGWLSHLDTL